ncbi:MAG: glycosyltransferase family 4 protein, partial [Oscillospiraceae bacterium]|nr:glycosyltransferase family 4 protein [Oscillospiraceae bacterium]
ALKAEYDAEAREKAARQEEFTLLYIGVLEERRSIPLLFETLAKVREQLPKAKLILVGKGEKEYVESCFAKARELGVWEAVEYHEKVPQSEVHSLYKRANLFVLPTRYEIFGMVLLEAMYFGLPAISSWNGGSSVLIEDGRDGIIQQEYDAGQYAEKILAFAASPERQLEMGKLAHEKIREQFMWDGIAARMLEEYKKL